VSGCRPDSGICSGVFHRCGVLGCRLSAGFVGVVPWILREPLAGGAGCRPSAGFCAGGLRCCESRSQAVPRSRLGAGLKAGFSAGSVRVVFGSLSAATALRARSFGLEKENEKEVQFAHD
jgi:hypothetical protein